MRKSADVLEIINDETAKVMLYKHKKCHGCGSCNKHMRSDSIFEAANPVQAEKGDMVDVDLKKQLSGAEITFTYILPILAFFGGLFLGGAFFIAYEIKGIVPFVVALASLVAARMVGATYKKSHPTLYTVTIVNRIKSAEPGL